MPNRSMSEIQHAMQQLRENFLRKLKQHADSLYQIQQQLINNDMSSVNELISLSHQLAGSCGTFHQAKAGFLARQIEIAAIEIARDSTITPKQIHSVSQAIHYFIEEVDARLLNNEIDSSPDFTTPHQQKQQVWLALDDETLLRDPHKISIHTISYQPV